LQGNGVEEAEGTDGLVVQGPGDALLEKVELEVADVFGSELIGRAVEMGDETQETRKVGLDGIGGIVTDLEVLEKALP
jgi:hypothetical protein